MVTGLKADIREPVKEQLQNYTQTEDSIQRLEIVQDWYRDSAKLTVPLKDVEITISDAKKERFKGVSGNTPLEIKIEHGPYLLTVNKQNYVLIRERNESKNSVSVSVEPSAVLSPILLIMIPTTNISNNISSAAVANDNN